MKLLRRTLIFINGILILSLLFGYLRQFTDPGQGSFLTIFSLLYPYIVILLCICLVLLLLIRSRWLWASLLALVLTSGNTIRQIGFHIQPDIPVDSTVYTLSTLNIKNNFRHKKMDQSTAFIEDFKKKNSTFLVLQEISGDQIRNIANALKYSYDSHQNNQVSKGFLAIFSQYPLTHIKSIENAEGRTIALAADIQIQQDTIRLFNIHLHTNAVTVRAEKFTPESFSKKEGLRAFNDMLRAYSENASLRLDEIRLINSEVNHSPYPVILAGDANDTPYSPVYRSLRGNRQNAFVKGGLGFAQTYNGLIVPLKIDHIFLDKTFFVYNTTIEKIDYSDHNPITTSFSLIRSHLTANY